MSAICEVSGEDPNFRYIVTCRWDSGISDFRKWRIRGEASYPGRYDKPWIVGEYNAGAQGLLSIPVQEFYLVWTDEPSGSAKGLEYRRSRDAGSTWVGGDVLTDLDTPGSRVLADLGWPLPRVHGNHPLYVGFVDEFDNYCGRTLRVVRGDDIDDEEDPHDGEVVFTRLIDDDTDEPIEIELNAGWSIGNRLPGWTQLFNLAPGVGPGVDMAVDPSDPDRLYLVYHDTDPQFGCDDTLDPDDSDVNIYMQVLDHVSGDRWSVGNRIRVDVPTEAETDQFMPQTTVDDNGNVHIIYYDDRDVSPDQPDGASNGRFDVFYAFSADGGNQWSYQKLCESPPDCDGEDEDRAVDGALETFNSDYLRDYNGIDWSGDRVWTSFMGLSDDDPEDDSEETIIWSSQILRP